MKDFLGQTIEANVYLAGSAGGNGSHGYGMLLYRVVSVDEDKNTISAEHLFVTYPDRTAQVWNKKVTLKNPNKYVVVQNPPQDALDLFNAFTTYPPPSQTLKNRAAQWVHGMKNIW